MSSEKRKGVCVMCSMDSFEKTDQTQKVACSALVQLTDVSHTHTHTHTHKHFPGFRFVSIEHFRFPQMITLLGSGSEMHLTHVLF